MPGDHFLHFSVRLLKSLRKEKKNEKNITADDEFHGILKSQKLCTIYG